MSDPEDNGSKIPRQVGSSLGELGGQGREGGAGAQSKGKSSPEGVIGKSRPTGRLNKRLILGVVGALGIGMLVLNFLPSGKGAKANATQDNVYANDTMPQDVKEMALKMPEASPAVAPNTSASGYQGSSRAGSPFDGYQDVTGKSTALPRGNGSDSANSTTRDYQGTAAAEDKIAAETAARRAPMEVATKLTAGLTTGALGQITSTTGQTSAEGASTLLGTASVTPGNQSQNLAGLALPKESNMPGQIYRDFNDQQTKTAFSQVQGHSSAPTVGKTADPALLPYTLFAGTIISAALETAINTDLPGDVLATVSENVFDSLSGKNLLIPQGSKLLAQYSSNVSFGQRRVQVAWQRLIRPDGVSLQLSNMNGVDPQGMSGYPGYVDEHWWEYAKGIGLMALFSIIDGQLQYSIKSANTQGLSDVANTLTSGIDQVGTQYTSNAMNVQPTISVKQGAKVQVFVNSDIIMPPANQRTVLQKYSIPTKEGENR